MKHDTAWTKATVKTLKRPGTEALYRFRRAAPVGEDNRRAGAAHRRDTRRRRAITADADLRLCRFFGRSDGWRLRLQADDDTEIAKAALARTSAKIKPWTEAADEKVSAH